LTGSWLGGTPHASGSLETGAEFARLVQESVTGTLEDILGQSGSMAVLYHLHIDKSQINTEEFHVALFRLFGQPAIVLEKMIIKRLYTQLRLSFRDNDPFDFRRSLDAARKTTRGAGGG
jgi:hypothetical protein